MKKLFASLFAALAALVAAPSYAAIDVAAVTTYLGTDITTAINTVGAAVLLLVVTVVGFRWVRKMIGR